MKDSFTWQTTTHPQPRRFLLGRDELLEVFWSTRRCEGSSTGDTLQTFNTQGSNSIMLSSQMRTKPAWAHNLMRTRQKSKVSTPASQHQTLVELREAPWTSPGFKSHPLPPTTSHPLGVQSKGKMTNITHLIRKINYEV